MTVHQAPCMPCSARRALQGTRCDRRNHHLCNLANRRAYSRLRLVWLAVAVAMCSSCGTPKPPATVEGTLRHNGVPLDHCLVGFFPEQGSSGNWGHAAGLTDQQGRFRLHNSQQQEGLDVGMHRVTIQDMSVSTGATTRPRHRGRGRTRGSPTHTRAPLPRVAWLCVAGRHATEKGGPSRPPGHRPGAPLTSQNRSTHTSFTFSGFLAGAAQR